MSAKQTREQFLFKMYDQMFNDINRHILIVWQAVGALVGAFALLALTEKQIISLDIAIALIMLIVAWLIAHIIDSNYWYNRNLVIIANIERQFLLKEDMQNIHYYFGEHRAKASMLTDLKIQLWLACGLGATVLYYHFIKRITPALFAKISDYEALMALPYILSILAAVYLYKLKNKRINNYKEFVTNSPGVSIDSSGIAFGDGHPVETTRDETLKSNIKKYATPIILIILFLVFIWFSGLSNQTVIKLSKELFAFPNDKIFVLEIEGKQVISKATLRNELFELPLHFYSSSRKTYVIVNFDTPQITSGQYTLKFELNNNKIVEREIVYLFNGHKEDLKYYFNKYMIQLHAVKPEIQFQVEYNAALEEYNKVKIAGNVKRVQSIEAAIIKFSSGRASPIINSISSDPAFQHSQQF